jgi:[CysO sulfur-carrier protein]-S-L-cysteine hydrolase
MGRATLPSAAVLRLSSSSYAGMVGHAYDGLPDEACGLLVGRPLGGGEGDVVRFEATENEAGSSKVYTIPALAHLKIERAAEAEGFEVLGVVHSHTHTDAYPSPTDIAQAPDPTWHYVIVSLRDEAPVLRSYRIVDGAVIEERVVVVP